MQWAARDISAGMRTVNRNLSQGSGELVLHEHLRGHSTIHSLSVSVRVPQRAIRVTPVREDFVCSASQPVAVL